MNKEKLSALLTLLEDENEEIASLAMEQFLALGGLTEETIAEHQESHSPQLRQRIHQLSNVLAMRQRRDAFVQAVSNGNLSLWEGMLRINSLYDPTCPETAIDGIAHALAAPLREKELTTPALAEFMREKDFAVPSDDILDVDLYLIERVLDSGFGSNALLCALAQRLGGTGGWEASLCLHGGRFCLLDRNFMILDPSEGWHISKPEAKDRYHICSRRDVLMAVLCQLFLMALVDGQLRDLHQFGTLLTGFGDFGLAGLPFPLGKHPGPGHSEG